jgi:hypothetical protein
VASDEYPYWLISPFVLALYSIRAGAMGHFFDSATDHWQS